MVVVEGIYSERDAVLNESQLCSYCELVIFAGMPCVILVAQDTPLSGKTKGYGFHGEECLEGWKKRVAAGGYEISVEKLP